jgi:hypothetical protein
MRSHFPTTRRVSEIVYLILLVAGMIVTCGFLFAEPEQTPTSSVSTQELVRGPVVSELKANKPDTSSRQY